MDANTWIKIGGGILFAGGLSVLITGCVMGVVPMIIGGIALFVTGSLLNFFSTR